MRRLSPMQGILLCTIPGIFLIAMLLAIFQSGDRRHDDYLWREPVDGWVTRPPAPTERDDRQAVEPEPSPDQSRSPVGLSSPSPAAPVFTPPDERAYDYVRATPNGPWKLIPANANSEQLRIYWAQIRPVLEEAQQRIDHDYSELIKVEISEDDYQRRWWDTQVWRQEQCAEAFRMIWPNAKQPDPVVRHGR